MAGEMGRESGHAASASGSPRERLAAWLAHLEHLLPAQAPIRDFVHHNTLHGLQHLPFAEALAEAARLTGASPWAEEALCREWLAGSRIEAADLDEAFAAAGLDGLDEALPDWPALTRRRVLHLAFRLDLQPPGKARVDWLLTEGGALERGQPGIDAAMRAKRAAGRATVAELEALWAACGDCLTGVSGTTVAGVTNERQAVSASASAGMDSEAGSGVHAAMAGGLPLSGAGRTKGAAAVGETPAAAGPAVGGPAWRQATATLWPELSGHLGRRWTRATLLACLTGEDPLAGAWAPFIRQLSAHLDRGVAGWAHPRRSEGFYAAWRAAAAADLAWELDERGAARAGIAALPDDPEEALLDELARLEAFGLDGERQGEYLARLALELPGWSGMFLWHERHGAAGGTVAMADYLAVFLVFERLHCEDLVRRVWGPAVGLDGLAAYLLTHPAELWVRHARFAGRLSEIEAHAAQRLIDGGGRPDDWQCLAGRIPPAAGEAPAGDRRWPLFVLAQHLGIDADALRAAGAAGAESLLTAAGLDARVRGQVWLLAYEGHYRRRIFAALAANHGRVAPPAGAAAQLVFCMDDREEGTRRHLEEVDPALETFGAAGFFGVPMYWRGLDDLAPAALCPVVVTPANEVREIARDEAGQRHARHARRRAWRLAWLDRLHAVGRDRPLLAPALLALAAPLALASMAWQVLAPAALGRFRNAAREAFDGCVPTRLALTAGSNAAAGDAAGTACCGEGTATDAPSRSPAMPGAVATAGVPGVPDAHDATSDAPGQAPRAGFTDAEQVERVAAFLVAIGLTEKFAPLVAIVGHGSDSANNPHAAAYDCGACSGRHGGPNARVFAAMANRPAVRAGLAGRGIAIPDGTRFIGAEHNTCDETIVWYDAEEVPASHRPCLDALAADLAEATRRHAVERCRRFASAPVAPDPGQALRHLSGRRHDWSQARPELGHATVATAFIGRRAMSRGAFFDRRAFLISYDPTHDPDGRILEGILLAAGPVGAGIALEYYFSTVDNEGFGCGTKITHNLAGLVGVMEGAASDLRTGLPRQMIEIHEPMRLLVVIEQARDTVAAIVERQPPLRELIGKGWINVAVKEPASGDIHAFDPARGWRRWQDEGVPVPRAASSAEWTAGRSEPLPPALLEPAA